MTQSRARIIIISAASGFVLLAAGATAGAAVAAVAGPVDSAGVIHACYANTTGNGQHAVLLENVGTPCPAGMTAISGTQQGPAGATGPQGPDGHTVLDGTGAPLHFAPNLWGIWRLFRVVVVVGWW